MRVTAHNKGMKTFHDCIVLALRWAESMGYEHRKDLIYQYTRELLIQVMEHEGEQ